MKPVALIILDGWGLREQRNGNAVLQARKPNFDRLWESYPVTSLSASGLDVGLPRGQMGNSEVGHLNLGAGRVVMQDLTRIDLAIEKGEFSENTTLLREFATIAKQPRSTIHMLGLLSDGGIHSHITHLKASIALAKRCGIRHCFIHAFTDGRDTPPTLAQHFLDVLQAELQQLQYGRIASVSGRFYAMDRDKRWERVEKAWQAVCIGQGFKAETPSQAVAAATARGETDEFITPSVIAGTDHQPVTMQDGDGVFFFNFRPDRCRELITALTAPEWKNFSRPAAPRFASVSTMSRYHDEYTFPVAFETNDLTWTLGELVSAEGRPQLHAAETEKFPHVTFFFNGGRDEPFAGEERLLIPSPRDVKTYDQKPQMSAVALTDAVIEAIKKKNFPFILINFANPDMVGHTGVLQAGIQAVETIDTSLGRVLNVIEEAGGSAIVTADHGNCEQMIADDGTPHTSHTTNRVPLIVYDNDYRKATLRSDGILADVAPTLIRLMGLEKSPSYPNAAAVMNGRSLLVT